MHKLGGFATTQEGSGMHQFLFRRDSSGVVRLTARQSSQASGWLPEEPGFEVFKTKPPSDGPQPARSNPMNVRGSETW